MGSYNKKSIRKKALRTKSFSKAAEKKIIHNLTRARRVMLNEFDGHPITREILQGASGTNVSKTLSGYGNLFSFIGFSAGSNPIGKVRSLLIQYPRIKGKGGTRNKKYFLISIPDTEDFRMVAGMPWESGRSWVEGIETGISGFGYYMANLFGEDIKSRSGSAVQMNQKIRGGNYKPAPYISGIINKLIVAILAGK